METRQLTAVGPGTPVGSFMREFWIPALLSSELAPEGSPVRLLLLGEKLIAFRTGSGAVGIIDHRCPHRCASMFYGRNEDEGLRCVYHGWKFAPDGRCLEAPNVAVPQPVLDKVRAPAYKVHESHGVVWVYMGRRAAPPPFPLFPVLQAPESRVHAWCMQRDCNYLQALEGDLDTSHSGFLHLGTGMGTPEAQKSQRTAEALSMTVPNPRFEVVETSTGVRAGAYRPGVQATTYLSFTNFILPFYTQVPPCALGAEAILRAWVPMDDTHTMFFSITTDTFMLARNPRAVPRPIPQPGLTTDYEFLPNTTDWLGRWRPAANLSNDHRIDRAAQRTESYTGIEGLDIQDAAVTESMGPVVDHSFEHLAPSDLLVVQTRRRLGEAAEAFLAGRGMPAFVDQPALGEPLWSGHVLAPEGEGLEAVYRANIPQGPQPKAPEPRAAA